MTKIVYLISSLKLTGPTVVLFGVLKNLDRTKFDPYVITISPEPKDSILKDVQALNIPVQCLNLSRKESLLSAGKKIKPAVEAINPDIVQSNCFRSAMLSARYLKKYIRFATVHCDWDIDFCIRFGKLQGFCMTKTFHWALKKMDCVICCSAALAQLLGKKYPKINFSFVGNGVDIDKFKPVSDKLAMRRKLGLPEDKKIFVWVGNLIPLKSPQTLLEAACKLNKPDNFYIFCGSGVAEEQYKSSVKGRTDIIFPGKLFNIQEYYQTADYYIGTSLSESFHLTAYEAMACGLPLLLSDIGIYDNIKNKGVAWFYKPADSAALARGIEELLKIDYQDASAKAADLVHNHYSSRVMAKSYEELYLKAL